jgi:hypothetical protein
MTARCRDCDTPLRRPSPDGLGAGCRRKRRQRQRGSTPARTTAPTRRRRPVPAVLGQLALPEEQP